MKKKIRVIIACLLIVVIFYVIKTEIEPSFSSVDDAELTTTDDSVEPPPIEVEEIVPKYKIVIDPGHGGDDSGAIGASGSYEKDYNLSQSKKIAKLLEQEPNIEVYMTREEDVFLSSVTRERPQYANDLGADLFISIHANTFTDPSVTGTETFYYHDNSLYLANVIHRHLVEATGFRDRGVTKQDFFVVKDTDMPAVLLEVGYLTNPQEEQIILTEEFQQSVAESIAAGIKEYLEAEPLDLAG